MSAVTADLFLTCKIRAPRPVDREGDIYLQCWAKNMCDEDALLYYLNESEESSNTLFKLRVRGGAPKVKKHYPKGSM